jgi:hypothetical protein
MKLLTNIFPQDWITKRPQLKFPLSKNQEYMNEVEKWLQFFEVKGWLTESLKKRLRTATSWSSFYAKINELRAGYFFEKKLQFVLNEYESPTINGKNAEFKGKINGEEVFIEVKSPLKFERSSGGSFDSSEEVREVLEKAIKQLPSGSMNIVVLSDDLDVSLFSDLNAQSSIITNFNGAEFEKISTVCILGNIFFEDMYKMIFAQNLNANIKLSSKNFRGFEEIKLR